MELQKDQGTSRRVHPIKFALWLGMISITIMFVAWTSSYVVSAADGALNITFPTMFSISTGIIVLSSVAMQWAFISAKRNDIATLRGMLIATLLLGSGFLAAQVMGWDILIRDDIVFAQDNPLISFIYVFTGMHALHVISGLLLILFTIWAAFRFKIHSKNLLLIELCATYWHFLGGLWIYLFIFLTLNL